MANKFVDSSVVRLAKICNNSSAVSRSCPLAAHAGCACQYVAYHRLSAWRQLFLKTPVCPSKAACDQAILTIFFKQAIIKLRN